MKIWNPRLYNAVQQPRLETWVQRSLRCLEEKDHSFVLGVNTYSQIVSAFRAQGDLTDEKLTILPVLQNALGISRERHTAEVKRALYDEQLASIASGSVRSFPRNSSPMDLFSLLPDLIRRQLSRTGRAKPIIVVLLLFIVLQIQNTSN